MIYHVYSISKHLSLRVWLVRRCGLYFQIFNNQIYFSFFINTSAALIWTDLDVYCNMQQVKTLFNTKLWKCSYLPPPILLSPLISLSFASWKLLSGFKICIYQSCYRLYQSYYRLYQACLLPLESLRGCYLQARQHRFWGERFLQI